MPRKRKEDNGTESPTAIKKAKGDAENGDNGNYSEDYEADPDFVSARA